MLCLPGLTPVAKLDQAVGDSEGWVEPSVAKVPSSASFFRLGSLPSSIHLRARVGSSPSKPITKTRWGARRRALPSGALGRRARKTPITTRDRTAAVTISRRAGAEDDIRDTSRIGKPGAAWGEIGAVRRRKPGF